MVDPRFYIVRDPLSAEAAAAIIGAEAPSADGEVLVSGVSSLDAAGRGDCVFVETAAYAERFAGSDAHICIANASLKNKAWGAAVVFFSANPKAAFAKLSNALYESRQLPSGDAPAVSPHAQIAKNVHLGPGVVIGDDATLAEGCRVEANAVIGPGVVLGEGGCIGPGAVVTHALLGARVRILANAVIGQDGFGFTPTPEGLLRIPQLGRVVLGDDVEIGANSTIDRGALEDTEIGAGTKIDNLVQIGHNVKIGRHCVAAAHTGISGSCVIGDGVMLGGRVGLADHLTVGDGAQLAAAAGVRLDVPAGETWGGHPARPLKTWLREVAAVSRMTKQKRSDAK